MNLKGRMSGEKKLNRKLSRLKEAVKRRVLRKAVTAASKPVLKAAKTKAPKQTGLLRKSLGRRTKTYRKSGVAVAVVGPREGFSKEVVVNGKSEFRNPVKYAHLVELGTIKNVAQPFLRPALDSTKVEATQAMAQAIEAGIEKELSK